MRAGAHTKDAALFAGHSAAHLEALFAGHSAGRFEARGPCALPSRQTQASVWRVMAHGPRPPVKQNRWSGFGLTGGFTLVEIVVTLMLVVLVVGMALSFFTFGGNFLTRTIAHAEDKDLAESAADYVRDRLLGASSVEAVYDTRIPEIARGGAVLFVGMPDASGKPQPATTGRLYYMRQGDSVAEDVFGSSRYNGAELAMAYAWAVDETVKSNSADDSHIIRDSDDPFPSRYFTVKATAVRSNASSYHNEKTFSLYNVHAQSEPVRAGSISSWEDGVAGKTFYLLVGAQAGGGYVTSGLVAQFDAIDNVRAGAGNTEAHHDPSKTTVWENLADPSGATDLLLSLPGNTNPVRSASLYFNGSSNYGRIPSLDLSSYSAITVEVVFREQAQYKSGMLFEFSNNWNSGSATSAFGVYLHSLSSNNYTPPASAPAIVHTNFNSNAMYPMNYPFESQTQSFQSHTNIYSRTAGEPCRAVWVNGVRTSFVQTSTAATPYTPPVNAASQWFAAQPFYLASRAGGSCFQGEIAAVRIYGRSLTAEEVAQNHAQDQLRFGIAR